MTGFTERCKFYPVTFTQNGEIMNLETVSRLRELVVKFKRSESNLRETIIRSKGLESEEVEGAWKEISDIVSEIKRTLGNEPVLHIPEITLKRTLTGIRDNNLKSLFFNLCDILKIDPGKYIPGYDEIYDDLHEEILDQVLPNELIENKMEIGTIILSQSIPPFFQYHLNKIRDCYCFNFQEAASIWARSLLEVGIKEALRKKGKLRSDSKVIDLEGRDLFGLINLCRGSFDPNVIKKMENVRREVNKLLHSEDISKKEKVNYLRVIKDTFQILENLFE